MSRFTIRDETVQSAFHILDEATEHASQARMWRERAEDERKEAKARAFLAATGSVGEREAQAILSDGYREASERFYEAVKADEFWRQNTSKANAIIEAWRTVQSNQRAMAKVG